MDMPEINAFPKSHAVTFKYYHGVIRFLEEDYSAVSGEYSSNLQFNPD